VIAGIAIVAALGAASVIGVVVLPGPPLVSATTESNTLSVPLILKMMEDNRIGSDSGRMRFLTRDQPDAPSSRADSMMSSGMSSSPVNSSTA